jgi:hypothetical protein
MLQGLKKWSEIRRILAIFKQPDLISFIGERYSLNGGNKYFIDARCSETCAEA